MMRKGWVIVLTLLVLVGCEKPKPAEEAHEICVTSQIPSRSIIEGEEGLREHEIKLFGSYTLDGYATRLFDAERLYYNTELPGWDYDNTQYWISKALYHFCAVCPYVAPCTFSDAGELSIAGYEGSTGGPDLLYASTKRNLAENEDFSTVLLQFNHACAAIQFNLINASNATVTDVRNIRLVGLHNRGDLTFNTEGLVSWVLDSSIVSSTASSQPFGGTCILPNGGLSVNLNVKHSLYDNGAILVLPQTIYKTPVTLHLEYIKEGDAEYAIRDIELGWLAGVSPTEWKSGEKYEYNMTITDNTITTEVRVVDWIDHYVDL